MAAKRGLGAGQYGLTRAISGAKRARGPAESRHFGQPVSENDGKRGLKGYDGGKKVNGRKRHSLVDTTGLLLKIVVHAASVSESEGGQLLLQGLNTEYPRLRHLWTDQGYKPVFVAWVQHHLGWTVDVVHPPYTPRGDTAQAMRGLVGEQDFARRYPGGFRGLPRRWVVERTFAWFGKQRRLSKDYELLPPTTEAWAYLAMGRLLLRRLAVTND